MPTIDLPATGENIRTIMAANNVTAADIADMLGFTTLNAVYRWLRGETLPTIDNLVILAAVLNTTLNDLIIIRVG